MSDHRYLLGVTMSKHRFQYRDACQAGQTQQGNLVESLDSGLRYVVTKEQPEQGLVRAVALADGTTCWLPRDTRVRAIELKGA